MNYKIDSIFNELKINGYAEIDQFWDESLELEIEDYYHKKFLILEKNSSVDKYGNRNFALADEELINSPFEKIKKSPIFINLYSKLLELNNINTDLIDIHNILSYQKNDYESKYQMSSKFHFDAFYITIIIPVKTPKKKSNDGGATLLLYPNLRKLASNSIFNYLTKFFIQNLFLRYLFFNSLTRKYLKPKKIKIDKNKILIFYGYRSLHGNTQLKYNNIKVQAIYHIFNPHRDSIIDRYVFSRNNKVRKNKLNKNK